MKASLSYDIVFDKLRAMVMSVLSDPKKHEWTLQGFGMLRTYITKETRLHVWDRDYRVRDVTDVHDHPWHFSSLIISGTIVNTRYEVHPCEHTLEEVHARNLRTPFMRSSIVCGVGGGNHVATIKERGELVWLEPREPEEYKTGEIYFQKADEVHHSSYSSGAVTLVTRTFQLDTEHAHVFFPADQEWVSAEPRDAKTSEIESICKNALHNWSNIP